MKTEIELSEANIGDTILGSLSNDDGNGNENVTQKYIFISFVLLRDYFNSLNFYKNGELPRNQIGRSGAQVKKENENSPSCVHVLHKTLNVTISRCCFAEDGREMYQNVKRTCRAMFFLITFLFFAALSLPSPTSKNYHARYVPALQ